MYILQIFKNNKLVREEETTAETEHWLKEGETAELRQVEDGYLLYQGENKPDN